MERNERLKAADKCASMYTDENEARIARKAFMLGCEFEAQGEIIKGVILDTKEEQPSEDLEAEIREWIYNPMLELTDKQERGEEPITTYISEFEDTARHFYELGKKSKEPVSKDLKEAAEEYEQTRQDTDARSDNEIVRRAFIAGAEWQKSENDKETAELLAIAHLQGMEQQKEQMLKEAVDAVDADVADLNGDIYNHCIEIGLTDEDKVKIVIVKEDKK